MRVLLGMPDEGSLGGPAACEPPFADGLRALGVEVEEETYVYGEDLRRPTGSAERVARVLRIARRLSRRLDGGRFDVLHLNTSFDARALLRDSATLALLPRGQSRIFLKFHGSDVALLQTRSAVLKRLGRRLLSRADGIGVLSSEERVNFLRAGVDERKLFVVKNVVRQEAGDMFADDDEADDGEARLLFISRFIPAKGLIDCVRACAILRERGVSFTLQCLGDGPARAEAEAEVARLGLEGRARFFGYVPEAEARRFYARSTMLLFPTYHYEGFPMVVFNSLAAGLPIITTRIRAAADYLREPENCLWVEPRSPEMLAEKILRLLDEPELRARMRDNNRRLAREFDAESVAREYAEVYRRLVRDASRPGRGSS